MAVQNDPETIAAAVLDGRRTVASCFHGTDRTFTVHAFFVALMQAMVDRHRATHTELNQQRTARELAEHQRKMKEAAQ